MQKLAKELDLVIIVPIFERQAAGVYRNSAAVIDADGSMLGAYRKMHIPDDPLFNEKYYFTPGDSHADAAGNGDHKGAGGFRVWKTRYADVGVLICWDQWYPRPRHHGRSSAPISSSIPRRSAGTLRKSKFVRLRSKRGRRPARARIANGVVLASPNRVGHEDEPGTDGIEFFGQSFIADPFGRILARAGTEPEVLVAKCDRALIETTRRNWPFLRDRRIDAYAPILNRYIG